MGRLPRGIGGDIFDTSACDRLTFLGEVLETSLVHVAQGVIRAPGAEGPSWDKAMLPGLQSAFGDIAGVRVRESNCGHSGTRL